MSKFDKKKIALCWMRNDLRFHDNEVLIKANEIADYVVPVYCFDPRHFKGTWNFNFPKTGTHRGKFLMQCVEDFRNTLRTLGSDLVVCLGKPEEVLPAILQQYSSLSKFLFYQEEVTKEEIDVEKQVIKGCETLGTKINTFWGATLYHKNDLPFPVQKVPDTYTNFRKAVEGQINIRRPLAMPEKLHPLPEDIDVGKIPTLEQLQVPDSIIDMRTAFPFMGGEKHALSRLKNYLWDTNNIETYKETRNGLLGEGYSTKFSPWLAHGCLSPRTIYSEIKKYEREKMANQSTYWVIFELIWRDYFRFICLKFGDRVFYPSGIKGKTAFWKKNPELFNKWKEGRTGVPFVDANMRELKETGWMSNRGRQNVASFLIKDLNLDWRLGAEWFESYLIDHDVCSNYGNWNYAAGIGNDPRENRKFNMIKQAIDYDPQGLYRHTWVPELCGIKGGKVHTPWVLSTSVLSDCGVSLGETYPMPVIVAPEWKKYESINEKPEQNKSKLWTNPGHNSRKRGLDFYFQNENK